MKIWMGRNYVPTRREQFIVLLERVRRYFWMRLGRLLKRDFLNSPNLRRKTSFQLAIVLVAASLLGIFVGAPQSNAVLVNDCSTIGQLRNGGFEAPAEGSTVINDAGGTYPANTVAAAQQNSSNSVTNAVYGAIQGNFWNHLDASADLSTYRTYRISGRSGDARVYWNTTEATEQVEFGTFITANAGSRFAELNATVQASLFQDIPTAPGITIRWSLAHRGRNGSETMRVYIGKPTNTVATVRASTARFNGPADSGSSTLISNSSTRTNSARAGLTLANAFPANSSNSSTDITDGQTWRTWYGVYDENTNTTTNTRFMFESVSPAGGSGNLLDSISFAPVAACPINRIYNSPTDTQTVNIFDTASGSFAIVPDESGHQESVTALTYVDGPGRATLNSGGRSLTFTPNGLGITNYDYKITYTANGIASTSDGRITITARDVFGSASCSPGSVETNTATISGQTTVIETFKAPVQANTDNDSDHNSASCTWTVPEGVFGVDYLVVGGGGGGSSGGGGGGGVVTSWATALASSTSTERTAIRNPLSVTPGEAISVRVGGGGKPGWGASLRCTYTNSTAGACTTPTRIPTKGSDSSFGSVSAEGGGFGGGSGQAAGGSGGSGGGSRFDDQAQSGAAAASQIIGASSFGNIGGGSTASGGYRAGGGGGGAGTNAAVSAPPSNGNGGQGGLVRDIDYAGSDTNPGNGRLISSTAATKGGGGHGGRGVASNIASFAGTYSEYGCGGGGGVNNNSNNVIPGGGGTGGCSSAGDGSSFATFLTTRTNTMPAYNSTCSGLGLSTADCPTGGNRITSTQFNGTAVPTEGFGGGGAGTDPEGDLAGSGGSGVVVIRYVVSNIACPNSSNATNVAGPIACPYPITIFAGAAVATQYNLSYGDATNGYVSFPGGANDTVTVTSTIANGIDTVTATVSGNLVSFAVSNANTALAGATYPIRYNIFSGSSVSTSFVLLRIADPSQATPVVIPVDPRATDVLLSAVKIGGSQMTQVCFTPIDDNDTPGYGNIPSVDRTTNRTTESRTVTASLGRLRLQGTSANLQQAVQFVRVTKSSSDSVLLPGSASRKIAVNVSNGTVGGNGSCTFGNESIIELRPLDLAQTVRSGTVPLKPAS